MKKYTISIKRKIKDLRSFNFDQAIQVLTLRNQGWTFDQIGDHLKLSHQRVMAIYKQVARMSVEEAERNLEGISARKGGIDIEPSTTRLLPR